MIASSTLLSTSSTQGWIPSCRRLGLRMKNCAVNSKLKFRLFELIYMLKFRLFELIYMLKF